MYWFKFILRLLFRLVVLRQEIQDARELDEDEEFEREEEPEAAVEVVPPTESKAATKPRLRHITKE